MHRAIRQSLWTILLGLIALTCAAAAPDPFEGTWEMDLARSTFKPGPAPITSQTRVFRRTPEGVQMTVEAVRPDGSKLHGSGTYQLDGRDYPFTGIPGIDQIALRQTSERVQTGVNKLNGRVILNATLTVSADHQTLTIHVTNAAGTERPVDNTLVFNRK